MYHKYKEFILYLIFGFLTTLISILTYYLLVISILNPDIALELQIANIISWIISVLFAYITNRKYVFDSNNKNKKAELFKFYISRIITLLIDMFMMFIFVTVLKYNDKIMKIISQIVVIMLNYLLSKIVVFNRKGN